MKNPTNEDWTKFYPDAILGEKEFRRHDTDFRDFFNTIYRYVPSDSSLLEIGTGPGKLLTVASLVNKYDIIATDVNKDLLKAAEMNVNKFGNPDKVEFRILDTFKLLEDDYLKDKKFGAIIHHGLVEHFEDMDDVKKMINIQSQRADYVIFGLPYFSKKNRGYWDSGDHKVYRNKWLYDQWEEYLVRTFNPEEVFYFDSKADNIMCVVKGDRS